MVYNLHSKPQQTVYISASAPSVSPCRTFLHNNQVAKRVGGVIMEYINKHSTERQPGHKAQRIATLYVRQDH